VPSARTRQLLALTLVVAPVAFAAMYAVREVPGPAGCNTVDWDGTLANYRAAGWWLAGVGEFVALAVLVSALVALRGSGGRSVDLALAMVAAGAVHAVWVACLDGEGADQPWYLGLLIGVPVGAAVWFLLNVAAGGRDGLRGLALAVAWLFVLPVVVGGAVVAVAHEEDSLVPTLVAMALPFAALISRLAPRISGADNSAGWSALALAAAIVAVLVIPATGLFVVLLPGPQTC
jgi:hypothetical protein